ncbi:MAG TPA: rubrerythrin [Geobacter sp.]|nr:rubrerythrin [Geobacter sp.]
MATKENLAGAFAGESQANRKYLAFAKKAELEGLPQVARLFRAAAHAETVHAHAHLRAMGGIKSTLENLKEAIEGEGFEFQKMYPPFLEEAKSEGHRAAEVSFRNALAVEEVHHDLYQKALAAAEGGADLADRPLYVCEICGHTVYDDAPDKCQVCQAPKAQFTLIA